jgi:two-component system response regulator YesN
MEGIQMAHILIVDDEMVERQAMRVILTKAFPSIQKLGEASNGPEAIAYVKNCSPELVLMDIKMPGMDGLQAIQEIKKLNEQTKFIMVSAFDTFDYAQKAIREGVKDYIVKPSKKQEIIQTISRVLQDMEKEKAKQKAEEDIHTKYHRAISQMQTDWVASLLLNYIKHESFYLESFSYGDYQYFSALVLYVGPADDDHEFLPEDRKKLYHELEAILKGACPAAIGPLMSGHIPVLLPFHELHQEDTIQSRVIAISRNILKEVDKITPKWKIRIGIGPPVEDVSQFADSYQKALLALEETTENVRSLYYHPSILTKRSETKLDEYEHLLLEVLQFGNVNAFDRIFYHYFTELSAFFGQSLENITRRLDEFRIIINRFLKEWQFDLLLPEHAFHSETLVQLREHAGSSLFTLVQHNHKWHAEKEKSTIFKAKDWIDAHFCEEVTLDEAAAKVQLSPYYFSKLFKESLGQTFIDYLTQKRIELSKNLLISTEKTFKEICFEVGYHDPNYFSRVFKKITGLTPSEFRKRG